VGNHCAILGPPALRLAHPLGDRIDESPRLRFRRIEILDVDQDIQDPLWSCFVQTSPEQGCESEFPVTRENMRIDDQPWLAIAGQHVLVMLVAIDQESVGTRTQLATDAHG
jgi:hypothetical protein